MLSWNSKKLWYWEVIFNSWSSEPSPTYCVQALFCRSPFLFIHNYLICIRIVTANIERWLFEDCRIQEMLVCCRNNQPLSKSGDRVRVGTLPFATAPKSWPPTHPFSTTAYSTGLGYLGFGAFQVQHNAIQCRSAIETYDMTLLSLLSWSHR